MALKVEKNKNEDPQNLVKRFSRRMRRSGILHQARQNQTFEREKSEQLKKRAALRRKELKEEYERKKKMGEL
ncbi:MAG: hypothetical protein V5A57_00840 [Candidatus Paceibacterota bacterium]